MTEKNNLKVTLDLLPENCAESAVTINEMAITYMQNADTCSDRDDTQFLTISSQNGGTEGDEIYYNISTQTHWSINNAEELSALVKDFEKRLHINTVKATELKTF